MLSILITLCALIFSLPSWSVDRTLILKSPENQYVLHRKNKTWVSETCLKSKCQALNPAKGKNKNPSTSQWASHPAAAFCEQNQGKYITASRPTGDQDGLCIFPDKSFILGWDFFYLNRQKK